MSQVRRLEQIPAANDVVREDQIAIWQSGRTRVGTIADIVDGPVADGVAPALAAAAAADADGSRTNAKLAAMPASTVKANLLGSTSQPQDVTLSTLAGTGNPLGDAIAARILRARVSTVNFDIDTRTFLDPQMTNGPYTNFDNKGSALETITNTEAITPTPSGGGSMRDSRGILTRDRDATNYEASGFRAIANGFRSFIFGKFDSGAATTQWKDMHGGWFYAIGRSGGVARGMSGILAEAVQLGTGVATNEFSAGNPDYSNEQAALLAPVLGIVYNQKADVDNTHKAWGVQANTYGYLIDAAFRGASVPSVGQPGHARYGMDLRDLVVRQAGICMPQGWSTAPNAGTQILYDVNDYSFYDRANDAHTWVIGGVPVATFAAGRLIFATGMVSTFASDAAADAAGVVSGQIYRIGRTLQMKP